jgi:hypothetical protein
VEITKVETMVVNLVITGKLTPAVNVKITKVQPYYHSTMVINILKLTVVVNIDIVAVNVKIAIAYTVDHPAYSTQFIIQPLRTN